MKNHGLLLIFLIFVSCSKGDSKDQGNKTILQEETVQISSSEEDLSIDTDGDGVLDHIERKEGTNPLIANIPVIEDYEIKELDVFLEYSNDKTNALEILSWSVRDGRLYLGWDPETPREMGRGQHLIESLLYSEGVDSIQRDLIHNNQNDELFSFSDPIPYEQEVFEVSQRVLDLKKQGYKAKGLRASLMSRIRVSSDRFDYFKDPVFDIYFKDSAGKIYHLGRFTNIGTYSFNQESNIRLSLREGIWVVEQLANAGGRLFIKLTDFRIGEDGKSYSKLVREVKEKSIPVNVLILPEDNDLLNKARTVYVGSNGKNLEISEILKRASEDNGLGGFKFSGAELDNWIISHGRNGVVNEIRINDKLSAIYLPPKNTPPLSAPSNIESFSLGTNKMISWETNSGQANKGAKLRIQLVKRSIPYNEFDQIRKKCDPGYEGELILNRSKIAWRNVSKINNDLFDDIYLRAIGKNRIEGPITHLIEDGIVELVISENNEYADIIFKRDEFIEKGMNYSLKLLPKVVEIVSGAESLVERKCVKVERERPDIGCRRCSQIDNHGEMKALMSFKAKFPEIQNEINFYMITY